MSRTLHLTNGRAIIEKVRAVTPRDAIVPWDDLLHEGPVPSGLGIAALRERRAEFLAQGAAGSFNEILRALEERDNALEATLDEIVLWFEHDLYDQLQLVQILERVPVDDGPVVSLVQPTTYLGHLPMSEYPALLAGRQRVTSSQRIAARDAWQAFTSTNPQALLDVLPRVIDLPHLGPALRRHLEQFPSFYNGLSRTEQQTLNLVHESTQALGAVFIQTQEREEAFFMGDGGFFFHISSLFHGNRPLLRMIDGERFDPTFDQVVTRGLEMTSAGEAVLRGELDRIECCGINRWLGGVYLQGQGPVWRYDRLSGSLQLR